MQMYSREDKLKIIDRLRVEGCEYSLTYHSEEMIHFVRLGSDLRLILVVGDDNYSYFGIQKIISKDLVVVYFDDQIEFDGAFEITNLIADRNMVRFDVSPEDLGKIQKIQQFKDLKSIVDVYRPENKNRVSTECCFELTVQLHKYSSDKMLLNYFSANKFILKE